MRAKMALGLTMLSLPAAAERIAALTPIVPDAAPEIVERLHDAVLRGLTEGGRSAVPAAEVRELVALRADLESCRRGPCVRALSDALRAQRILSSTVEIAGKNYNMSLELLGGGTGRVLASTTASCDICTLAEAEASLQACAANLAKSAPPWPPAAPVAKTKAPAEAGVRTRQDRPRTSLLAHRHDLLAFGAVVVGTAAAIGGGYLVARHGDCSERDSADQCTALHNTGAVGAALIGAGVVAFGGAAIATWLGIRSESRRRVYLAPSSTGGVAGALVEF